MRFTRLVALVTLEDVCLSNDNLESMITPWSFSSIEQFSLLPPIKYWEFRSGLLPILMMTRLSGWNLSNKSLVQSYRRFTDLAESHLCLFGCGSYLKSFRHLCKSTIWHSSFLDHSVDINNKDYRAEDGMLRNPTGDRVPLGCHPINYSSACV